jgi:hypothetical protein
MAKRKRSRAQQLGDVAAFASLLALTTPAGAHVPIRKVVLTDQVAESAKWKPKPHRGFWGKGTLRSHQPYPYDGRYYWGTR